VQDLTELIIFGTALSDSYLVIKKEKNYQCSYVYDLFMSNNISEMDFLCKNFWRASDSIDITWLMTKISGRISWEQEAAKGCLV
jgi:hypothetical protein